MKSIAGKLRRNILLHFGLVTFRFHYGRDRKPVIFMISGFSGVSLTPQTNTIYLWRHQDTSNNPKKPESFLTHIMLENINILEIDNVGSCGKERGRKIPNILNMGSISSREHEIETLAIWEQYLPTNIK